MSIVMMSRHRIALVGLVALLGLIHVSTGRTDQTRTTPAADTFPVTVQIDAGRTGAEMRPVWRFFGHDEPNYTTMKDGKTLLGQIGRAHV